MECQQVLWYMFLFVSLQLSDFHDQRLGSYNQAKLYAFSLVLLNDNFCLRGFHMLRDFKSLVDFVSNFILNNNGFWGDGSNQHGIFSKILSTAITVVIFEYLVPLHGWLQRPENIAAKRKHRKHVLVCAPSNSALDEIVLRLLNTGFSPFPALLLPISDCVASLKTSFYPF